MAVITISRQFGTGGKALGMMIADELGYDFADNDIIQRLAKEANVSSKWIRSFEKEAGSNLSRFMSKMVSKRWLDRVLSDERGYLDEQIYLDYMVLIIAQIADEGNVVILGRGSQYILDDHPDAFHIFMIDEFEHRVKFMVEHHNMMEGPATQLVKNEDKRRKQLYQNLMKKDFNDPALYHLVLNMGKIDLQRALKIVHTMVANKTLPKESFVATEKSDIRVLLVDDEETLIEYVSKRLLREGYSVKAAFSGEEAIEIANSNDFDVAVVDLKMPGIDGVKTQKRLKQIQPFLQSIILTGHGTIDSALETGRDHAYKYLLKPIEYEELLETINEAYETKMELQNARFKDEVDNIYNSGLGARGIKKAMNKLRKIYGIS